MAGEVHRLEGSGPSVGGLVIRKKQSDDSQIKFKAPSVSKLGLDRLAAKKEQEKREIGSGTPTRISAKRSSDGKDDDDRSGGGKRKYRERLDETPSHPGGVDSRFKERQREREERHRRGYEVRNERRDREDRNREYRKDRERKRGGVFSRRDKSERRRDWEAETPRRQESRGDGYETPYMKLKDTPSQQSWEDDYDFRKETPNKFSSWDVPTPKNSRRENDERLRSVTRRDRDNKKYAKETPLPTPSFKRKRTETPYHDEKDKEQWDEEQKRLDREWYSIDEGYDESHNPFSGVSEEYTRKKEEVCNISLLQNFMQTYRGLLQF